MNDNTASRNDQFLRRILEESKQFTADLIKENESLRYANLELRNRIADLERQAGRRNEASVRQRIRILEQETRRVRTELQELQGQLQSMQGMIDVSVLTH